MLTQTAPSTLDVNALHAKLDALQQQLEQVNAQLDALRQQRELWHDLGQDLTLVMEDAYTHAVDRLEDLDLPTAVEDLTRLLVRVARNARLLEQLLQDLEALHDLARDLSPVAHEAFDLAVHHLDALEKQGVFARLRSLLGQLAGLAQVLEPQDIEALGQMARQAAQGLKALARPEVQRQVQALLTQEKPPTVWDLMRLARDPEVRRGLALGLMLIRTFAQAFGEDVRKAASSSTT